MRAYELLPGDTAVTVGHLLPVLEVVVGVMLVLGVLVRGAAAVSALLFVAFIIGIASVWARGIEIDCGCFGGGGYDPDATSKYPWEIARDVGAARPVGVPGVAAAARRWPLDSVLFRSTPKKPTNPSTTLEGSLMSKKTKAEERAAKAAAALAERKRKERRRNLLTVGGGRRSRWS